jgi:glucose-6-phosphate 1-dehydrogenase
VHAKWVEESWRIYTPLLDAQVPVHPYPAGTWGPDQADRFFTPDGGEPRVIPSMAGAGER